MSKMSDLKLKLVQIDYWKAFVTVVFFSFAFFIINLIVGGSNSFQFNALYDHCNDILADLTNNIGYASHLDPYNESYVFGPVERIYPPMVYLICYCLSRVVDIDYCIQKDSFLLMIIDGKLLIIIFALLIVVVIAYLEVLKKIKKGTTIEKTLTAIAIIISFPFIFSLERGNFIILCGLLNLFFLFFHDSNNKVVKEIALLSLAFSASIKFPPAFLGIILLYEKRWKEALRTILYGIAGFIVPMMVLKGGLSNIGKMIENNMINISMYSPLNGCTFPAVINMICGGSLSEDIAPILKVFTYLISAIMLISIPFLSRNWLKIGIICLVLTIVPSHSGTYCLVYLFPLIVAFLNEENHTKSNLLPFIGICMLVVYDPLTYVLKIGLFILVAYAFVISVMSIVNKIKSMYISKTIATPETN